MNLTKDQTHTVIMALKEYQGIFCHEEDQDVFNGIEKLKKRFERSLKRKLNMYAKREQA